MKTSKYYIANGVGGRLSLNIDGEYYITNIEGLGINNGNNYSDIENGFFRLSKEKYQQQNIVADIRFIDHAYENYQEVADFISMADELYFVYCPLESKEYYREIKVESLSKIRRTYPDTMVSTISMLALTPWYLPVPLKLTFTDGSATQWFRYNVTPYGTAPYAASLSGSFGVEVTPSGHLPAGVEILFEGSAANPKFTLTGKASGKVYGECSIIKSFPAGSKISLSTDYTDSFVKQIQANGEDIDLMPDVDITKDPFFRVPLNEACEITITAEDQLDGEATASINYYYRSV